MSHFIVLTTKKIGKIFKHGEDTIKAERESTQEGSYDQEAIQEACRILLNLYLQSSETGAP